MIKVKTSDKIRHEIGLLASQKSTTESRIGKLIGELINKSEDLSEAKFWDYVNWFMKELDKTTRNQKVKDWNTKNAVDSFRCEYFRDDLMTFVSFVKMYEDKVTALHNNHELNGNIEGVSDDGLGDLLDSFPLHGKARYRRAMKKANPYETMEQLEAKNTSPIELGENNICLHLRGHLEELAGLIADAVEEPSETVYKVEVCRTGYGVNTIEIRGAGSEEEAKEMALDEAGDHDFSEHSSEYNVNGVSKEEMPA